MRPATLGQPREGGKILLNPDLIQPTAGTRALSVIRLALGAALVVVLVSAAAYGAAPAGIGKLVSAETNVEGGTAGAQAPLNTGSEVFANDSITTDASGLAQIEFVDNTKLAIGPGSSLTLDRFVYDPSKNETDIVFGFGTGAFRFITGEGSHQGYQIDTPVATIGVRGTAFDVAIGPDGEVAVAMISGTVEVCSRRTLACRVHNAIGQFLDLTPDGVFSLRDKWDSTLLHGVDFAKAMPFMVNDGLLQPTFRAGATVLKQYASAAGQAAGAAGKVIGQAADTVGQAANTAGQTAGKLAQAPVQALQGVPRVLQKLNPFGR
jgi:hypothetical protein